MKKQKDDNSDSSAPISDSGDSETAALCQLGQRAERVEPEPHDRRNFLFRGRERARLLQEKRNLN